MSKNFVNYHILFSHSPSCLNRDDMNMQKTAVFGGKRRVRISSQSLKRTMRTSEYYKNHLGNPSIRTRKLDDVIERFVKDIKDEDYDEDIIKETMRRFIKDIKELEEDRKPNSNEKPNNENKHAVAPWIKSEIKIICQAIKETKAIGYSEDEEKKIKKEYEKQKTSKNKKSLDFFRDKILTNKIKNLLSENSKALAVGISSAIDVALSGRMATSGLMKKVDGPLAVAHPITTHVVESDIDWFTAVDDLQELGSGHLDTQEFSSGVFYRYASLNLSQLQENLGGATRERALEIGAHVLHMLAILVPSAKQQSFAAHNLADLALVSLSDQPISLANAFESPVSAKGEGFLKPSILALHDYWRRVYQGYELDDRCAEFGLHGLEIPEGITVKDKLSALESWVRSNAER